MSSQESLAQTAKEVMVCTECTLHLSRKIAVPGEGPADAEIMLIGEAPGYHENELGRPFVGAAGSFLNELLGQAKLKREDVWITNIVKCRPPGNRDPMPEEISTCNQYLERQIAAVDPKIIITLGRYSMGRFMPGAKISQVHGQMRRLGDRFVIAMFHPAAALHQAALKPSIMADFAKLPGLLETARRDLARKPAAGGASTPEAAKEEPKQMNLF
jgi:uracil-DNA glycosylase family 4